MSNMSAHGPVPYYFVPEPSRHPAMASLGLFFVILGASQWINGADWGRYSLFFGLAMWLFVLYQWFARLSTRVRQDAMATKWICRFAGA